MKGGPQTILWDTPTRHRSALVLASAGYVSVRSLIFRMGDVRNPPRGKFSPRIRNVLAWPRLWPSSAFQGYISVGSFRHQQSSVFGVDTASILRAMTQLDQAFCCGVSTSFGIGRFSLPSNGGLEPSPCLAEPTNFQILTSCIGAWKGG